MKYSRILAFMPIKTWFYLLLILLSSSTSKPEPQKGIPSAGLECVSHCDSCPVVCSPRPSPRNPPPSPPPSHHHSPPESYYIAPPAHPAPEAGEAVPPPPALYVYTPRVEPGTVQQNFSYPYYYFYASKAAKCSLPLHNHGFIVFVLFVFFQVLWVEN